MSDVKRTNDETLIAAMRALARDIRSPDGVANAAIEEAAQRLDELVTAIVWTLDDNEHLADGDDCTLKHLVDVMNIVKR